MIVPFYREFCDKIITSPSSGKASVLFVWALGAKQVTKIATSRTYNLAMASPGTIAHDQADVLRVLHDYYQAFSTLSLEAVLPYFHEPAMLIGPQGALAAPTHSVVATAVGRGMEALRACGFGRSELIVRTVRSLSATAVMVQGVAQRYKLDGQALDRAGVTYVLHRAAAGWKIAVLILHDPDDVRGEPSPAG